MSTTKWPIQDWVTALQAGHKSAGTVDRYSYHVRTFARSHPDPWAVTPADVQRRLAGITSPEYARAVRVALNAFYAWAVRSGAATDNPVSETEPVRVPPTQGRPCPESVWRRALLRFDPDTALMVLLAATAGLRRAEVAQVHTRDVDGVELHVIGKGGAARTVYLTDELRVQLARRPPGWVFPSPVRPGRPLTPDAVGRRLSRALGDGWSGHTLRHRMASAGYASTRNLIAIQQQLGHRSVATTQRYIGPDLAARAELAAACA